MVADCRSWVALLSVELLGFMTKMAKSAGMRVQRAMIKVRIDRLDSCLTVLGFRVRVFRG